jgi:hypothetical protein
MKLSAPQNLDTWTYSYRLLERVPILGSTLNVVSLKSYGLPVGLPGSNVPADRKALASEGMGYQVRINIGGWL